MCAAHNVQWNDSNEQYRSASREKTKQQQACERALHMSLQISRKMRHGRVSHQVRARVKKNTSQISKTSLSQIQSLFCFPNAKTDFSLGQCVRAREWGHVRYALLTIVGLCDALSTFDVCCWCCCWFGLERMPFVRERSSERSLKTTNTEH